MVVLVGVRFVGVDGSAAKTSGKRGDAQRLCVTVDHPSSRLTGMLSKTILPVTWTLLGAVQWRGGVCGEDWCWDIGCVFVDPWHSCWGAVKMGWVLGTTSFVVPSPWSLHLQKPQQQHCCLCSRCLLCPKIAGNKVRFL